MSGEETCAHEWVNEGPRIPLRYGSAATEVCSDCGSWRQTRVPGEPWSSPASLAQCFVDPEESVKAGTLDPSSTASTCNDSLQVPSREGEPIVDERAVEIARRHHVSYDAHPTLYNAAYEAARAALLLAPAIDGRGVVERCARVTVRPFAEWHEDHGDVLWFRAPIQGTPYCGSPLDLGATCSLSLGDALGRPINLRLFPNLRPSVGEAETAGFNVGGWPFDDEDESDLWWIPLPALTDVVADIAQADAIRKLVLTPEERR